MATYEVKIKESSKELSAKERIAMKDTSNAIKLDEACEGKTLTIKPSSYCILSVHNDKADDPDYDTYIIADEDGNKYTTGSESFWNSFKGIWDEMQGETEDWSIDIYKLDSKNRAGKQFITCSIK